MYPLSFAFEFLNDTDLKCFVYVSSLIMETEEAVSAVKEIGVPLMSTSTFTSTLPTTFTEATSLTPYNASSSSWEI